MDSDDDKILSDLKFGDPISKEMNKKRQNEVQADYNVDSVSDSDSDQSDSEYKCSDCNKKFSGYTPFVQHQKGNKHAKAILKKKREKKLLDKITRAEIESENDEECLLFAKKPYAICKPCDKQFGDAASYHSHVVSKVHRRKILQASILDQVKDNGKINVQKLKDLYESKKTSDKNDEDSLQDIQQRMPSLEVMDGDEDNDDITGCLECEDCQKSFSGIIPYTQHILSKVHAKTVHRKNLLNKMTPVVTQHPSEFNLQDVSTLLVEDDVLLCRLCSVSFNGPENVKAHLKSRRHKKTLTKWLRKKQRKLKPGSAAVATSGRDSASGNASSDASEIEENFTVETEVKNSESTLGKAGTSTEDDAVMSPRLESAEGTDQNDNLNLYC